MGVASVTPWSSLGYVVYKRTYSRQLDDSSGNTEEWADTVERVLTAAHEQLGVGFTVHEEARLRDYMLRLKGTVAGRFLWQLGTETVDRLGLPSLQNCAFVTISEPVRPFTWAFEMLMLGSGVGFSVQREHVYKLPPVREDFQTPVRNDTAGASFIVPDTREGWVELLRRTLESAFNESYPPTFDYSTQLVRGKGTPIKGFGGVASGPEDLCWGIAEIGRVLAERRGKQLRPIDCLDIMNIIAFVVVSGNVRRSAQIALGDCDDIQYLRSKRWDLGVIPKWRAMSNNSVVCNDFSTLPEEFWEGYRGKGEPFGIVNLKLSRAVGRLGDTRYKDPKVMGVNPCSEQSLEPYETCCLAEVFLPNVDSYDELIDLLKLLYRVNKHSLALPCNTSKETERVVHRNMRMGIGITGYLQTTEEQKSWLPRAYEELRAFDVAYSKAMGFPPSIKLTTFKPSGTLSLLPGVTPGIHPGYAKYMIRRMRISSNHPLVETCRNHGYKVEYTLDLDGQPNLSTVVVEFPFMYSGDVVVAKDVTAVQQLEYIKRAQTDWSDNAVSCTVYYRPEELDEIRAFLGKHYNKEYKAVSFLLHSGHGFAQAPYEEITKEHYEELVGRTRLITSVHGSLDLDPDDPDCLSGSCPIR